MRCTVVLLTLLLAACSETPQHEDHRETSTQRTAQHFARSCGLCHIDGTGGAPTIGDTEEWSKRLAQGREVLLQRTIEGHNNMPPLGYCMACEVSDFNALIDLMTAGVSTNE